jgi:hypothetical protein
MQDTKTLTAADLRQFTGTEQWYRHGIVRDVLFTDGAKYVADQAGAYWLIDEIAFAQRGDKQVAGEASGSPRGEDRGAARRPLATATGRPPPKKARQGIRRATRAVRRHSNH